MEGNARTRNTGNDSNILFCESELEAKVWLERIVRLTTLRHGVTSATEYPARHPDTPASPPSPARPCAQGARVPKGGIYLSSDGRRWT